MTRNLTIRTIGCCILFTAMLGFGHTVSGSGDAPSLVRVEALRATRPGAKMSEQQIADTFFNSLVVVHGSFGTATGLVISSSGHILTRAEILPIRASSQVVFAVNEKQQKAAARIVKIDRKNDLAILKLDAPVPLLPLRFSRDSRMIRPGEPTLVINGPATFSGSARPPLMITGKVSRIEKSKSRNAPETLFNSAAIPSANAGGPVFNRSGEVIGIVAITPNNPDQLTNQITPLAPIFKLLGYDPKQPIGQQSDVALDSQRRTWTDSSGRFRVDAELLDLRDQKAIIRKPNCQVTAVPIRQLSDADRSYIDRWTNWPPSVPISNRIAWQSATPIGHQFSSQEQGGDVNTPITTQQPTSTQGSNPAVESGSFGTEEWQPLLAPNYRPRRPGSRRPGLYRPDLIANPPPKNP